jgi:hypothetical protein
LIRIFLRKLQHHTSRRFDNGDSGWKLMKYWPKQPIFTSKVGLSNKSPSLTGLVT